MINDERSARTFIADLPDVGPDALEKLDRLAAALADENTRQNLISGATLYEIWRRHFADSAQLLHHVPRETRGVWLDLGSGAGFPGLVIACLRNDPVVLVESRKRRVEWLERMCCELWLPNARVAGCRLEQVDPLSAAVISARAFAPLDRLLPLASRFSTSTTRWLLPKGRSASEELKSVTNWPTTFHVEQSLTDPDAGIIVGEVVGTPPRKGRTR